MGVLIVVLCAITTPICLPETSLETREYRLMPAECATIAQELLHVQPPAGYRIVLGCRFELHA